MVVYVRKSRAHARLSSLYGSLTPNNNLQLATRATAVPHTVRYIKKKLTVIHSLSTADLKTERANSAELKKRVKTLQDENEKLKKEKEKLTDENKKFKEANNELTEENKK